MSRPKRVLWRQTDEATALLRDDVPQNVKIALRLSRRGGRQLKGCLVCGKPARHAKLWIPDDTLRVMGTAAPRRYLLCDRHDGHVTDDEVRQRLYPHGC